MGSKILTLQLADKKKMESLGDCSSSLPCVSLEPALNTYYFVKLLSSYQMIPGTWGKLSRRGRWSSIMRRKRNFSSTIKIVRKC